MIVFTLCFLGLSTLLACAGALLMGSLTALISAFSLGTAAIGAFCLSRSFKLKLEGPRWQAPDFLLYALVVVGIYFHSVFFFFKKKDFYWIQDGFNLGDMSFHWGVIRNLGQGGTFWPENPIFMGYRFKYPFAMDLFNALWESLGVSIATHLPLVTLASLLFILYVLHICGGPLLVFAVFFSGGVYNFLSPRSWDITHLQEYLDFKNLFLSVLLTQRGFLFALPAGIFLYRALQKYFAGEWQPRLNEKLILGLIWGSLGFFHLHSFFFLSLYLGILILWKRQLKKLLPTLVMAALLGLPFVVNALIPENGTSSLIQWSSLGWGRKAEESYLLYWLKNLGPWILVMLTALVWFYRQKKWNVWVPAALAFAFFVLFSHLILAPWPWDNIKLILWCYLFGLMAISDWLWNQRSSAVQLAVFILFFVPGLVLFVNSLPHRSPGVQWTSERELNKAAVVLKNQNVNQGLVITPTYEHPALLLGYKLYMGYPGHVWSHGYKYLPREQMVNRLYSGDDIVKESLSKDGARLIYRGPLEKRRETAPLDTKGLSKVGEALDHELYLIN